MRAQFLTALIIVGALYVWRISQRDHLPVAVDAIRGTPTQTTTAVRAQAVGIQDTFSRRKADLYMDSYPSLDDTKWDKVFHFSDRKTGLVAYQGRLFCPADSVDTSAMKFRQCDFLFIGEPSRVDLLVCLNAVMTEYGKGRIQALRLVHSGEVIKAEQAYDDDPGIDPAEPIEDPNELPATTKIVTSPEQRSQIENKLSDKAYTDLESRGEDMLALGRTNEALELLNRAIEERPAPVTYRTRCRALIAVHRFEEAIQDCTRAIDIVKEFPRAYGVLEAVQLRQYAYVAAGKRDMAEQDAKRLRSTNWSGR
jgi:tetratricopeptide (TPR) repeat protein